MKHIQILLGLTVLALSGCGQSPGTGSSGGGQPVQLSGLVLSDETPVTHARIEATDSTGKVIASTEINGDPHYRMSLSAGSSFPLVLIAHIEGKPEVLKAAVTNDLVTEQDISSVTTIVVNTAMNLGGLTETNLAKAAGAAISQRKSSGGSGGSAGFKGDPTKQYGGWH